MMTSDQHQVVYPRMQAIKHIHPKCFGNTHLPSSGKFLINNKIIEGLASAGTQLKHNLPP
jgi:hypothetical protein